MGFDKLVDRVETAVAAARVAVVFAAPSAFHRSPATAIILAIALTLLFAAPLGKGVPLAQASVENTPATGLPTISGTVQVGETLMTDTSNIADEDGLEEVSFTYQWLAGDADISGAAGSTYTLANTDEGKTVKVQVSFTDDADNEEILTSGATDAVAAVGARAQQLCSGGSYDPAPTKVEVEGVPIVVESTIDEYFVLYVRYDLDVDSTVYLPVSVTLGQAGTTALSENVAALPKERYQVHKYLVADPADVDGDCIDDITELADPVGQNPVNSAATLALSAGALAIPDRDTFEELSRQGTWGDQRADHWEFVKFFLVDMETDSPGVYFMNTSPTGEYLLHRDFMEAQGVEWDRAISGEIAYNPDLIAPGGSQGIYSYRLYPFNFSHEFTIQERSYRFLAASLPLVNDDLALHIENDDLADSQADFPLYENARINLVFDQDMYPEVEFQALNTGEGYGLLRVREPDDRPHPREIVVYEALPHELPRVAGIITTAPQTLLSHINLRAIQDGVPNAFIRDALDNPDIDSLLDNYVHYTVTEGGWTLRAATPAEVEAHYAASRPATDQTPQRDLSVTEITALRDIEFDDWKAFGVKAANVAVLRTLGFPDGTVPDGFAVPFHFYDEFMRHNGFYDDIEELLADSEFQTDFDTQESELKKLRKKIKKGETPEWINAALTEMHAAYPEGQSLRYRSSTNNEDLPGFNGAGLYDSKTQHPEETEEDGIAKSLKQVFASMWNFRAFSERDFHRIDHLEAAMGVLVHPNYSDELANGVAVSFDPIVGRDDVYYVNTQLGEDLVTNPEAHSIPEEILLYHGDYYNVLGTSNQVAPGQLLLTTYQLARLRRHLEVIHEDFKRLYKPCSGEPFAMEIEFKITSENILAIKQARPWVFNVPSSASAGNSPAAGAPRISGTAQVGETLTANTSCIKDTEGLENATFSYQWRADGTAIQGATDASYTLVEVDEGKAIRVRVSFTDDAGNNETLTSAATGAVSATPQPNSPAAGAPTISGTAQAGETLTVSTSGVEDADGMTGAALSYQWVSSDGIADTDIREATGATYTLVADDIGKTIKVRVSFTDDAGNEETLTSAPTAAVEANPNIPATGLPTIRGRAQVGETLTADTTGVADPNGLENATFGYQWLADGTAIDGATGRDYTLTDADQGKSVKVRVTFTDDGGNEETLTSAPTGPVWGDGRPGAPRNLAATPGNKEVTLSWEPPDDNGNPPVKSYRIQWRIDGKDYDKNHWGTARSITYTTNDQANLANGVKYFFRVKAENGSGNSYGPYGPASEEASATPTSGSAVNLGTPVLSDTENLHHRMVKLDWEDIEDAGWYVVQYYHIDGGNGEWLDLPAVGVDIAFHGSSAVVSNLDYGIHWLRVGAASCAGASEWSQIEELIGTRASDWKGVPVPEVEEGDEIEPCPVVLGTPVLSDTETLHHGMVRLDWQDIEDAGWYVVQYYHIDGGSGEWVDLPAEGVDIAFHGSSAVVSNLHGLSWLRVGAMSCAGASEWSQIEQSFGTKASDWEGVTVPEVGEGDENEPCDEDSDTPENSPATGLPTISGTAQVGETLTADTSGIADADGLANATFSYQWITDDSVIVASAAKTYTPTDGDRGKSIKVRVSFTDDAGNEETLTSANTATVEARANSPATGLPTISGTAQVGETLTANTSGVADADGLSNVQYEYRWLADDTDIAGATGLTYTLADADEGKAIKVRVSFTDDAGDDAGNEETLTSAATNAVAAAPTTNSPATGAPTISGTAQVGETLTANTSGIADADGLGNVQYEYEWLADDAEIAGATGLTYTLTDSEESKAITVRVSFTDDAGNGETLTSAATEAAARPNSLATGAPTISGTVQVGETLTANTSGIADADGLDDVSFTYQWLADDSDISGATNATYTLAAADEGKAVKVEVSFTDDADNDESLTSAATEAVAAAEPAEPPDKPRGLEATATHDSVTLTWDDPQDDSVTGYVILRRVRENDQGGEFSELVADTGTAAATYTDDTVAASTTYTYRIKAINGAGTSERSRWVHIDIPAAPVPDKPTGLSATATHDSVTLTWNDPGDDSITGYVILRRNRDTDDKGHFDELVADTGTAATTYTDDTVAAGTSYTYRIKAINGAGPGERSRWYHIDTPAAP